MQPSRGTEAPRCVALTGASGHVGAGILRELRGRDIDVRVLARDPNDRAFAGLRSDRGTRLCIGALEDEASLATLLDGAEAVIHCAALVSLSRRRAADIHRINVEGTQTLLSAAERASVTRFVQVSSVHSYRLRTGSIDERAPRLAPHDLAPAYDQSKARSEELVLAAPFERGAIVVQPSSVIGPFDYKPSRLGRVLLAVARGRLAATLPGSFDFVDSRDVARGVVDALLDGASGEAYLLTGHHLQVHELVEAAAAAATRSPPRLVVPTWVARGVAPLVELGATTVGREPALTSQGLEALASNVRFSSAKAKRELGFRVRPLDETLHDTLAWFREEGLLR